MTQDNYNQTECTRREFIAGQWQGTETDDKAPIDTPVSEKDIINPTVDLRTLTRIVSQFVSLRGENQ